MENGDCSFSTPLDKEQKLLLFVPQIRRLPISTLHLPRQNKDGLALLFFPPYPRHGVGRKKARFLERNHGIIPLPLSRLRLDDIMVTFCC